MALNFKGDKRVVRGKQKNRPENPGGFLLQ
jgi:hypothetical protein